MKYYTINTEFNLSKNIIYAKKAKNLEDDLKKKGVNLNKLDNKAKQIASNVIKKISVLKPNKSIKLISKEFKKGFKLGFGIEASLYTSQKFLEHFVGFVFKLDKKTRKRISNTVIGPFIEYKLATTSDGVKINRGLIYRDVLKILFKSKGNKTEIYTNLLLKLPHITIRTFLAYITKKFYKKEIEDTKISLMDDNFKEDVELAIRELSTTHPNLFLKDDFIKPFIEDREEEIKDILGDSKDITQNYIKKKTKSSKKLKKLFKDYLLTDGTNILDHSGNVFPYFKNNHPDIFKKALDSSSFSKNKPEINYQSNRIKMENYKELYEGEKIKSPTNSLYIIKDGDKTVAYHTNANKNGIEEAVEGFLNKSKSKIDPMKGKIKIVISNNYELTNPIDLIFRSPIKRLKKNIKNPKGKINSLIFLGIVLNGLMISLTSKMKK